MRMLIEVVTKLEELAKQHRVLLDYIDKEAKLAEVLYNPQYTLIPISLNLKASLPL